MEHDTDTAPNTPSQRPGDANLEAYGDWVTVDAGRAATSEPPPPAAGADVDDAHEEPDTRSAQDLTAAEEELLDQLSETERAAAAATPVAEVAPPDADTYATDAALAKLERQLSSLTADLKAVGQQLAELRGRGVAAPTVAEEPAGEPASPPPAFAADAGDGPVDIALEELDSDADEPVDDAGSGVATDFGDADPAGAAQAAAAPPPDPGPAAAAAAVDRIELVPDPEPAPEPELPPVVSDAAARAVDAAEPEVAAPAAPAAAGADISGGVREDVRSVLAYLDQLLDALPPDKVREFAQSEHFTTYKKLFREFDLDD